MKKFIVMFIAFIFVLAFVIGQCNDDTPDDIIYKVDNVVDLPIEPKREDVSDKIDDLSTINSIRF